MAKRRTVHACQACGAQHPRWHGRCPDCGQWDSLVEETYQAPSAKEKGTGRGANGLAALVPAVDDEKPRRLGEIDRLVGVEPGGVGSVRGLGQPESHRDRATDTAGNKCFALRGCAEVRLFSTTEGSR